MFYSIIVILHIIFVFGFLLAHSISVWMAFALKKERDIQKIHTSLNRSAASYPVMLTTLFAFFISGIIAGFQGGWWKTGWIWVSIVLLIAIVVLMMAFGGGLYGEARREAGIRYNLKGKWYPPEPAKSDGEVLAILAKTNPILLTIIGFGGFVVIGWLMTAKPF